MPPAPSSPATYPNAESIVAGGGLGGMPHVTHLLLHSGDPVSGRQFLRVLVSPPETAEDLRLTTTDGSRHRRHVALGVTAAGLRHLGVAQSTVGAFPAVFREGAARRADRTGDTGPNGPARWIEPLRDGGTEVHIVLSVWHGDDDPPPHDHAGVTTVAALTGSDLHREGRPVEHFGYADGLTNPQFLHPDDPTKPDYVPPGEFLLGHEGQFGDEVMRLAYPEMSGGEGGIGRDGSFAVLRVMRQDVDEFERLLDTAPRHGLDQETLAGLLCGRRRDGTHLGPTARPGDEPDFAGDPSGGACPIGSHIRRANPRAGAVVTQDHHARRLIRRGKPYTSLDGTAETGLLGYFLCASLAAQYEAMLNDWLHGGVHHPTITGTNDPLVGLQPAGGGVFRFLHPDNGELISIAVPQLVYTRGVLYLFLPGRRALERLAGAAA